MERDGTTTNGADPPPRCCNPCPRRQSLGCRQHVYRDRDTCGIGPFEHEDGEIVHVLYCTKEVKFDSAILGFREIECNPCNVHLPQGLRGVSGSANALRPRTVKVE